MQTFMPLDTPTSTLPATSPVGGAATAEGALALVMGGADPWTVDMTPLQDVRLTFELLNRAAATLLGQQLLSQRMSRPRTARERLTGRRESADPVLDDTHQLAAALAEGTNSLALRRWLRKGTRPEPLLMLSKLQLQVLVSMCQQIDITAEDFPVPKKMYTISSREKLVEGGRISNWMKLMEDDGEREWLHATSSVSVNGTVVPIVTDAGPDMVSAAWAARLASPVSIRAAHGCWPVPIVEDALNMCAGSIAAWVAAMSRELAGVDDADLSLRSTVPMRNFIVAPAVRQLSFERSGGVGLVDRTRTDALIPGTLSRYGHRDFAVAASLWEPGVGEELGDDIVLDDPVTVPSIGSNELAILSLATPRQLGGRIPVTVNIHTPEWEDVTDTVSGIQETRAVTLREATIGHVDQDVIEGDECRITLRVLVDSGVPLKIDSGYAVAIPAGTKIVVTAASVRKHHALFYGITEAVMDAAVAEVTETAAAAAAGLLLEATESIAAAAAASAAATADVTSGLMRERTWMVASSAAADKVAAAVKAAARDAITAAVAEVYSTDADAPGSSEHLRLVS